MQYVSTNKVLALKTMIFFKEEKMLKNEIIHSNKEFY